MGSLKNCLRALERRNPQEEQPTSATLEEARALDTEIRKLEKALRTEGVSPFECLWDQFVDLLDEQIARLEAEIAQETEQCPEA